MTVKELITMLSSLPQNATVILSKDSEGNDYSPMSDTYSEGRYLPTKSWYGDFYDNRTLKEKQQDGNDLYNEGVAAIVLWPIN